ncbi:MAG: 30S ribosomal protein S27ae [Promethearchaeota archaeon]
MSAKDYYKLSKNGKIARLKKNCPRCGLGTFMAEHSDRWACGKCGWTQFKKEKAEEKVEKEEESNGSQSIID